MNIHKHVPVHRARWCDGGTTAQHAPAPVCTTGPHAPVMHRYERCLTVNIFPISPWVVERIAPDIFNVCWRSTSNVDELESQYGNLSLLSWACRNEQEYSLLPLFSLNDFFFSNLCSWNYLDWPHENYIIRFVEESHSIIFLICALASLEC